MGVTRDDDALLVACHVEERIIRPRVRVRARGCGQRRGLPSAAVERVAVSGSGRRGTSRAGLKRYLAISDGIGSEAQRGRNVVEF